MAQKKIPMRMCVGCREMRPKKELIRIVRSPEGEVHADPTGRAPGRGRRLETPDAGVARGGRRGRPHKLRAAASIPSALHSRQLPPC